MKRLILLVIFVGLMVPASLYGVFDDLGWSIRARGMANAFFGVFDAVNSFDYNPACVANAKNIEAKIDFGIPYAALSSGAMNNFDITAVIPFSNRPYHIWFVYLMKGLTIGHETFLVREGAVGFRFHRFNVLDMYYENVFSFVYAKNLDDVISKGARISAGLKLNVYNRGLIPNPDVETNPYLSRISSTAVGLDVGVTYDFSYTIRLGLGVFNLIKPNVALIDGNSEYLPRKIKFGANWAVGTKTIFGVKLEDILVGVGVTYTEREPGDNREMDLTYHYGGEVWFLDHLIGIRAGYENGINGMWNINMGFSINYVFMFDHEINLDYAFTLPGIGATTRHYFGIAYRYHLPPSAFAYTEEKKKELEFLEMLERRRRMEKQKGKTEEETQQPTTIETNTIQLNVIQTNQTNVSTPVSTPTTEEKQLTQPATEKKTTPKKK